ncbi:spermatogenesis-associated protein 7 isoform X2 [Oenanthe melanoleuca]|uniref:spermatogenesis-associated protein 7 isoform X2 n=1 Tax=Oenanthe melanoleuca TaxID=2939378 RepID=UPI0024C1D9F1|nr:spermatogenesis-associated protein 7 isoform X2 [Oenanthe melanoleuca]
MGLKSRTGGRRSQVTSRCGPGCPFKGHCRNKSHAFCIDPFRHLPGEYLIRNHMVFHYKKINSAKAAVDTSVPKSRLSSIKLADQLRREKLKKKTGRREEKTNMCDAVTQCYSSDSRRPPPPCCRRTSMDVGHSLFPCSGQAQYLSKVPCACGKDCWFHSCPVKHRKCCRHTSRASHSNSSTCVSRPTVKRTIISRSRSAESLTTPGSSQRCPGNNPKGSCGDPSKNLVSVACSPRCPGNIPKASCGDPSKSLVSVACSPRCPGINPKANCGDPTETLVSGFSKRCPGNNPKANCGDPSKNLVSVACSPRCPVSNPKASCGDSIESLLNSYSRRCPGSNPRASCGDLLERHSECFTKSGLPFTPRTLLSDAKSCLSQCRYYTPPRKKKKNHRKHGVEVETQTDMISFPTSDQVYERKCMSEEQKMKSKAEDKRNTLHEPERRIDGFEYPCQRKTSRCPQKCSSKSTVNEDEELLYLSFIEDVTDEILRIGVYSNRVLNQVFESHIQANKHRLDEGRMRRMLDVLKSDLCCGQKSEPELKRESQGTMDPRELEKPEELECPSKGHGLKKAPKREELCGSMDFSLKEPNKCGSLSWSDRSGETHSREVSSEGTTETLGAGTECDFCGVEFEEDTDTPRTFATSLPLTSCDSDLDVSKELAELEASLAHTLHIARNYS